MSSCLFRLFGACISLAATLPVQARFASDGLFTVPPTHRATLPVQARSARDLVPDEAVLSQGNVIRHPLALRQSGISISNADVSVQMDGAHVETVWSLTLSNSTATRREAVTILPVPEGALLKAFSYGPAGQEKPALYPARLMPAREARKLYDEIVARSMDPALLEFAGYGAVRSSVFPVEANSSVIVNITYEQLLSPVDGKYEYVLPRTESIKGVPLNLRMEIRPKGRRVYSPTHELVETHLSDGAVSVRLTESASRIPGNFRLYWEEECLKGAPSWSSLTMFACPGKKVGEGYFLLFGDFLSPARPSPREITLVIDRSGSMRGEKMERAKEAARHMVKSLGEQDFFNLVVYNEGVDCFAPAPVAKSPETEKSALEWLDAVQARGGTNIHEALKTAIAPPLRKGLFPAVLFLTDGQPTIGETDEREIIRFAVRCNSAQRRLFTLGLGTDVNAPLLRKLGEATRAGATFIFPGEDILEKLAGLEKKLREPAFTDPVLTVRDLSGSPAPGLVHDLTPSALPDVFAGSPLVLCGRYSGKGEVIHFDLKGKWDGEEKSCVFSFSPETMAMMKYDFVPRIWAARKIGELQGALWDQGVSGTLAGKLPAESREIMDEMIRLSVEFGIMTDFTSFFADDGSTFAESRRSRREKSRSMVPEEEKTRFWDQWQHERDGKNAFNGNAQVTRRKEQTLLAEESILEKAGLNIPSGVRNMGRESYCRQGHIWVDSSLMTLDGKKAVLNQRNNRIVRPGTPEFDTLVDRLVEENRQGLLTLEGDINFRLDSEFILLKKK